MLNFKKINLVLLSLLISGISFAQVSKLDDKTYVVKANDANLKLIEILNKELDVKKTQPINVKVIQLIYNDSIELQPLLQNVMNLLKPNKINNSQFAINKTDWDSTQHGVILADARTNQLIILSDDKTIVQLEKLIKTIDVKTEISSKELIIKLKNAKADSIANIINNIGGKNVATRENG